jgi:hypothetical protein
MNNAYTMRLNQDIGYNPVFQDSSYDIYHNDMTDNALEVVDNENARQVPVEEEGEDGGDEGSFADDEDDAGEDDDENEEEDIEEEEDEEEEGDVNESAGFGDIGDLGEFDSEDMSHGSLMDHLEEMDSSSD